MSITLDGSNGVTTTVGAVYNGLQSGTAVATTSGTSITFSSIPAWVKRITVMLNGVSGSGTSPFLIQVGSGSVTTTGYVATCSNGATINTYTAGFAAINVAVAASNYYGSMVLTTLGSNIWVESGNIGSNNATYPTFVSGGGITLAGTLDRVVLTTVNGTDTFDAGSVNIIYE